MNKPISNNRTKDYLGDGIYGQFEKLSSSIIMTTEDGISVQNEVYLGPSEVEAFIRYAAKFFNLAPLMEEICGRAKEERQRPNREPVPGEGGG